MSAAFPGNLPIPAACSGRPARKPDTGTWVVTILQNKKFYPQSGAAEANDPASLTYCLVSNENIMGHDDLIEMCRLGENEGDPNGIADDLGREAVASVAGERLSSYGPLISPDRLLQARHQPDAFLQR